MTTDWRELPRISDPSPARASVSPGPSQPAPKNSLACERCFKRKQKCDRLRPACTSCADLGVECVARSQQFDFNAEDAGLTHARVNGYYESLKRRVTELEDKVRIAEQKHAGARHASFGASDALSPLDNRSHRSIDASMPSNRDNEPGTGNGEDQSTVQDTMSAIGLLSNKAMAESRANTGDVPHKLAITESISAALAVDGRDPSKASSSQPMFVVEDQLIPLTRDLTLSHMQRFLDWIVFLPYIDEARLMEQYDSVLGSNDMTGNAEASRLPHFNTYLAIAIGISMSPEASRLSSLATNLHCAAVKLLPLILHSQEPFDTLHCMLLLAVFSMFSPAGGSTWHLMGFIMTNCIAAGLHKTVISQDRLGADSIYRTEWLFWSLYLLDRSLASSMGRPFGIAEGDISVPIPEVADENNESLSESSKAKLNFSRHLVIHAQLISDMRGSDRTSPLFSYSNLCFWREFSPPTDNATYATQQPFDCLDQLACRALILMINPIAGNMANSGIDAEDYVDIEADTISCCKRLIEKLYSKSGNGITGVSFLEAYDILAAAVAYVYLVQRAPQSNQQGLTQTFEVVSKASILLTQCSSRFSALSVFQQFLLALSTKIMEGQTGLPLYQESIPPEIPSHLRRLVLNYPSTGGMAG
ncbi:hypothetical protein NW762_011579 [Fusarium torreyae]|uniref:Zn(2)-C6 fungal-type domain-containing protein n=1 Tax=Fusarium torreyae TaxID=1237075 RepID=A0A9W8RSK4_9HYPO|nr:hypothetical protein NW762_011579 [Fusarium torreyae]